MQAAERLPRVERRSVRPVARHGVVGVADKFIEAYEQRRDQHGLAGSLHAEPATHAARAA